MKLPVPYKVGDDVIDTVTIRGIKAGMLADTKKMADTGDLFRTLQVFVSNGLESIGDITDRGQIKNLVGLMPQKSAEFVATEIALLDAENDDMEGAYSCPRCGHSLICEGDTCDHFSDLKVEYSPEPVEFLLDFENPIKVDALDGEVDEVNSLSFAWPTLNDGMSAWASVGSNDPVRLQLAIYKECLSGLNGFKVEKKWKNRYAREVLEGLSRKQLREIGEAFNKYGVNQVVKKNCPKCSKIFDAVVSTSGFFVSALR